MIENYKVASGPYRDALPEVQRRLNGYLASYDQLYVGATTNPAARWAIGHAHAGWTKMVLLYESDWLGSTRGMERALIAYARRTNFRVKPENVRTGGEGLPVGADRYWVYVLVG